MNGFHNSFKDLAYFFWIVVILYFVQVVTEITIIDYKKVQNFLLSLFSMQKDNYTGVSYLLLSCGILGSICYSIYDYYKKEEEIEKEEEEEEEEEESYCISIDGNEVEGYGDDKAYEENFKKLAKNGKRILKFSDGATYEGNIKDGLWHGKGIHKDMNGYKAVAEWKNHKLNGYANITFAENDERLYYKGNLKDGLFHGKGEMKWKNEDEYDGNWVDDRFEGYGEYWWADTETLYAGEWKNNNMHGKGQMEEDERKWVGEWIDDEKYKGDWVYYDDENEKEDKTEEIETIEENIEAKVNMDSLDDLPPSPVKSIDDLDLEPEKKKKVEEATIFVKKDGTFDESRGAGIRINRSLQFIKKIKGIDIEKIVFTLKTFQTMDETVPPFTDVNGSWHIKGQPDNLHISKCFSEESFEQGLDELLKSNNISKNKAMVDPSKMVNGEPLKFYVANTFIIDIPPTSQKLIVIKEIDSKTRDWAIEAGLINN